MHYEEYPNLLFKNRRLRAVECCRKRAPENSESILIKALDVGEAYAQGRATSATLHDMRDALSRHIATLKSSNRDGVDIRLAECTLSALSPDPVPMPMIIARLTDIDRMHSEGLAA